MKLRGLILLLGLGLMPWVSAADPDSEPRERSIVLAPADRSVSVTVRHITGRVTVEGHEEAVVRIELEGAEAPAIDQALRITDRGHRIEIQGEPGEKPLHLRLQVPRRTSLRARAIGTEPMIIVGLNGSLELSNRLGDIEARSIVGSVVAESEEGRLKVELLEVSSELPTALSTFQGDVELVLPADLSAQLSLRSKRGAIRNDFAIEPPADQARGAPDPRIVRGTVADGGVLISIKTYNGDISVRSAPAAGD